MPEESLQGLASGIERAGLRVPASIMLDMLSPFDVITSQLARFSRPLLGGTSAEPVAKALGEPAAWAELRRLLGHQD